MGRDDLSDAQSPPEDLARRLGSYLERWPEGRGSRLDGFRRLAAGWECEVFAFDLAEGPQASARSLVLRLYAGPEARVKAEKEFAVMRFVQAAGYPVPRVYLLEVDPEPLGRPFVIMDRVDGERYSAVLHRSPYPRKRELVTQFSHLLVDLHALDWRPFAPEVDADSELGLLSRLIDQMEDFAAQRNLREVVPGIAWLRSHAGEVGSIRPAVVHFDYHMQNLLIRPDETVAVLDWTQGQVQDFRVDLAWTLLLMGMYDGWAMREGILGEYRRLAPWPVESIEYFEVLAAARRLFVMLMVLGGDAPAFGIDPRAAAQIQSNLGHLAAVYTLFLGRTGITVPSAERVLASWDGGRR